MPSLKDTRHSVKKKNTNQQQKKPPKTPNQNTLEIQDLIQLPLKFVGFFPAKYTAILSYIVLLHIFSQYWF